MTEPTPIWDDFEDALSNARDTAVSFPDPRDERIEALEEALRPFARAGHMLSRVTRDTQIIWLHTCAGQKLADITAGNLRTAARAMGET